MGLGDALVGGIVLPAITTAAATLLKRAGKPQQSPEDWAVAFELLVAAVLLATTLAFRSVGDLVDAQRGAPMTELLEARCYVAGALALVLLLCAMSVADWLRGRFEHYEVQRLPPGAPTRETVAHLGDADVRSTNVMSAAILVAVYPICALLPQILVG